MLRGTLKPTEKPARLKLLLSGPAGVGKTTAALQMPRPYLIDCEEGASHYGKLVEDAGGAVFSARSLDDVIDELRMLATEPHPFRTVIIDPMTTVYNQEVDRQERLVGNEFGRHYGAANKPAKRVCWLLAQLDLNVVVTSHSKTEYGPKLEKLGETFDSYKKLDYVFDLWLALSRTESPNGKRTARQAAVRKTRLDTFPDGAEFPWSYTELAKRYGKDLLEAEPKQLALATRDQVDKLKFLVSQLTEDEVKRLKIDKVMAEVEDLADLPAERVARGIALIEAYRG